MCRTQLLLPPVTGFSSEIDSRKALSDKAGNLVSPLLPNIRILYVGSGGPVHLDGRHPSSHDPRDPPPRHRSDALPRRLPHILVAVHVDDETQKTMLVVGHSAGDLLY